jgi:hypothetical protein
MKKMLLMALALMFVGLLTTPVLAQRWAGGPGWYGPTDQTTIKLRQELWQTQRALYDELGQAKPNAAKVRTLTAQVNTLRNKLFSRTTQYQASRGGYGRGGWGYHMGYGPGYGMGPGYGYHMMGPGYGRGYGGGGCW